MFRKGKIRWGAVLNAVAGIIAIAGSPEAAAFLPVSATVAHLIALATLVNATLIKPAVRKDAERVL